MIMPVRILFEVGVKSSPGYKGREYVISKVEERIDQLLEQGPDNKSTLSGMVFATDDGDDDDDEDNYNGNNDNNEGNNKGATGNNNKKKLSLENSCPAYNSLFE